MSRRACPRADIAVFFASESVLTNTRERGGKNTSLRRRESLNIPRFDPLRVRKLVAQKLFITRTDTTMKDKEERVIYRANRRQKFVIWCQLRHKCSSFFSNCLLKAGMTNISVNWINRVGRLSLYLLDRPPLGGNEVCFSHPYFCPRTRKPAKIPKKSKRFFFCFCFFLFLKKKKKKMEAKVDLE